MTKHKRVANSAAATKKEKPFTVNVVAMQIKGRIPQIKYNYTEEENCQKFLLATTLESIFYSATSRK